jgi:hypothetical protein
MFATVAMADVEGKRPSGWRGECDRLAVASDIHFDGCL